MHKHHIIPRHAGGSDDPSNIKVVTIAEHAEEHRKLFARYGRWQDELAWKALLGQVDKEAAIREVCRRNGLSRRGIKLGPMSPEHRGRLIAAFRSPETKKKRSLANKGRNNPRYGKTPQPLSPQAIEKCRAAHLGKKHALGYKYTQEQRQARSVLQRGSTRKRIECPHCLLVGGSNNMKRWHFDNCGLRKCGTLC
jgi:hypothetical protein